MNIFFRAQLRNFTDLRVANSNCYCNLIETGQEIPGVDPEDPPKRKIIIENKKYIKNFFLFFKGIICSTNVLYVV
jgi:hypothetical protein